MDNFKPLIAKSSDFVDPLSAKLYDDEDDTRFRSLPIIKSSGSDYKVYSNSQNTIEEKHTQTNSYEQIIISGQSYEAEWIKISKASSTYPENIISLALTGQLRSCRFRSLCWALFLKVLPYDSGKWLAILREKRERYEQLRLDLMVTPGVTDQALDPNLNNPLSQDEQSPWNQYFEDHELKKLIRLDVNRTFPEVQFFQSPRIQEMMVSILFVFARLNPKISYVQGMHEVLAPLIFIIHCDHQSHAHAHDMNSTPTILQQIMDETYIEHDSYSMLEAVMAGLSEWYAESHSNNRTRHIKQPNLVVEAQPFSRPQDAGPTSFIVQKLASIHDDLLQDYEPDIYLHLNQLEIPPQVYGIRWARLMFGREFPITDLLLVWDAIFAIGGRHFSLLEHLMISMLTYIKDDLISSDYIPTLNLLMRYPQSVDAQTIIRMALHYYNPKAHLRPAQYSYHLQKQTVVSLSQNQNSTLNRSSSLPRNKGGRKTVVPERPTSARVRLRNKSDSSAISSSPPSAGEDPLDILSFSKARLSDSSSEEEDNSSKTKSNVVKNLVKNIGGKLGRPNALSVTKALPSEVPSIEVDDDKIQQLQDISLISSQIQDASREDDDEDQPQNELSHEDLVQLCLDCTVKLCHHKAALATRHAQLDVDKDRNIKTAMEGISQVILRLRQIHDQRRKSSTKCKNMQIEPPPLINHPLVPESD